MSEISNQKLQLPPHVFTREFEGDIVLLDLNSGEYFALDALGGRLLTAVLAGQTANEFASSVEGEFDPEPLQIRADFQALLMDLVERKLLVTAQD